MNVIALPEPVVVTIFGRVLFALLSFVYGLNTMFHPYHPPSQSTALALAPVEFWGSLFLLQGLFAIAMIPVGYRAVAVWPYWSGTILWAGWAVLAVPPLLTNFFAVAPNAALIFTFIALTHYLRLFSEIRMHLSHTIAPKVGK